MHCIARWFPATARSSCQTVLNDFLFDAYDDKATKPTMVISMTSCSQVPVVDAKMFFLIGVKSAVTDKTLTRDYRLVLFDYIFEKLTN